MTTAHEAQMNADESTKVLCEKAFQNGSQRTQIVNKNGMPIRGFDSRVVALLHVADDESVWARAKVPKQRHYEWKCLKRAVA